MDDGTLLNIVRDAWKQNGFIAVRNAILRYYGLTMGDFVRGRSTRILTMGDGRTEHVVAELIALPPTRFVLVDGTIHGQIESHSSTSLCGFLVRRDGEAPLYTMNGLTPHVTLRIGSWSSSCPCACLRAFPAQIGRAHV